MPDPAPTHPHLQGWAQVLLALAAVIGSLTGVIGLFMQDRNATKIDGVETRQNEVKEDLDKKAKAERQSKIINLLGTWKWLEEVAETSPSPKAREDANKAKRVYEEFRDNGTNN